MSSTRTTAARLYHELFLEVEHLKADIDYEVATSVCVDCPVSARHQEFAPYIADSCCKDNDDWRADDFEHIAFCRKLMTELKTFAGSEEIEAAQSKATDSSIAAERGGGG